MSLFNINSRVLNLSNEERSQAEFRQAANSVAGVGGNEAVLRSSAYQTAGGLPRNRIPRQSLSAVYNTP